MSVFVSVTGTIAFLLSVAAGLRLGLWFASKLPLHTEGQSWSGWPTTKKAIPFVVSTLPMRLMLVCLGIIMVSLPVATLFYAIASIV